MSQSPMLWHAIKVNLRKQRQAPPIQPVSRDRDLPLSFAQQRLWVLHQLQPSSAAYNMFDAYRLSGPLDPVILRQSLNEIVRRHQVLRTTLSLVNGEPVQIISPALSLSLPMIDLRELLDTDLQETVARQQIVEAIRQPFDLAQGPLLRGSLLWMRDQEYWLVLVTHHIVGDQWSRRILFDELWALYKALDNGTRPQLPELSIQYADYAVWQREWLQGEVLEEQRSYWKQKLDGELPALGLPTDRPRPPIQTHRGAWQHFILPDRLSKALKMQSQQEGVTLFTILLASFKSLLYRYTGQTDILVGSSVANRNRREVRRMIGFIVNTVVMRTDLGGNPSFRDLLRRVRETVVGAYTHQDFPFELLVKELQPVRDLSRSPLFQVMFVFGTTEGRQSGPAGLTVSPISFDFGTLQPGTSMFDLTVYYWQHKPPEIMFEYNTDLFDAATIVRMMRHFQRLLEGIVTDPDQHLSDLPLLTDSEQHQMLVEWNNTRTEYPYDKCVHELFEAQVKRTPDAIAVVFANHHLTYRELNRQANQLAHRLKSLGVGPEVPVGICMERSPEMVVGLLGILKAGGAYVPLDPTYPQERLAFMLEDTQALVVLTQARLTERLPTQKIESICLDTGWEAISQEPDEKLDSGVTPENLAYVIYTSGSTGKPKGTLIPHRGVVNYMTWCQRAYPLGAGRGAPVHSSISFDLTVTSLFGPLLMGGQVHLLPEGPGVDLLSTALWTRKGYSLVKITPAHLELLGQLIAPQEAANLTQSFIIGGENLLAESIAFWQKYADSTMLVNEYGPTEAVVGCCVYQVPPGERRSGAVPIGHPIINTQLYILDRQLQPVPIGVPGELYIGGVGLARGYHNRPKLTAEAFIPNPFSVQPGARLYKTGDLARYLPDGNIEFLGRVDHQVKMRGYRIELGEVEATLIQHPTVRETVITVRENEIGDKRLVAYVVPEQGQALASSELRHFLQEKLPAYMIPSIFVILEALPLTPNGKVNHRALPEPDRQRPELERAFVAPRTLIEKKLAGIWARTLDLEQVGIYDNFFDLGGHSLLATQLISRIHDAFQVEIPLRELFETPMVAGIAEQIETIRWAAQTLQAPPRITEGDREEGEL